jgi:hypothetical protein
MEATTPPMKVLNFTLTWVLRSSKSPARLPNTGDPATGSSNPELLLSPMPEIQTNQPRRFVTKFLPFSVDKNEATDYSPRPEQEVPVKNCWIKKVIVTCANFIWNFRLSSYT